MFYYYFFNDWILNHRPSVDFPCVFNIFFGRTVQILIIVLKLFFLRKVFKKMESPTVIQIQLNLVISQQAG